MAFFRKELEADYDKGELDSMIAMCFEDLLHISRAKLSLLQAAAMSESEMLKFTEVIKELKKGRPIQYVLGKADFYGMRFLVNEQVLIPRPETEELVQWIKENHRDVSSVLDIGTGSGCIAIALKKIFGKAEVSGLDVSKEALKVARKNAEMNDVGVQFIHADILAGSASVKRFDLIVSNPPYVRLSEKESMHKNVREHEPHLALFVDNNDPLLFYRAIANYALGHLNEGGSIYFEINEAFGNEVKGLLQKAGFTDATIKKDLSGKERFVSAKC